MAFTFTLERKANVKRHRVNINQMREQVRMLFYARCDIVNGGKLKMKLRKSFLWDRVSSIEHWTAMTLLAKHQELHLHSKQKKFPSHSSIFVRQFIFFFCSIMFIDSGSILLNSIQIMINETGKKREKEGKTFPQTLFFVYFFRAQ